MIFDEKKNLEFYKNLGINGRYAKAVDFLLNTDLEALEPGKYEIDGKDVVANVSEYTTIPWEEAKYEAHEVFTDIQYVIRGSEIMTYAPTREMTVKTPYNPDKDVVFYENTTPGLQMAVKEGQYVIFNPWDAHKPKAANGQPAYIKKVIVKIKEN
ncbi:MAG: YhcH/YjgK/YiaL family protein [Clostridium sp.]|nr:YhcH/YjgK/YiaL family protein [Clostridium sp.]